MSKNINIGIDFDDGKFRVHYLEKGASNIRTYNRTFADQNSFESYLIENFEDVKCSDESTDMSFSLTPNARASIPAEYQDKLSRCFETLNQFGELKKKADEKTNEYLREKLGYSIN